MWVTVKYRQPCCGLAPRNIDSGIITRADGLSFEVWNSASILMLLGTGDNLWCSLCPDALVHSNDRWPDDVGYLVPSAFGQGKNENASISGTGTPSLGSRLPGGTLVLAPMREFEPRFSHVRCTAFLFCS